MNEEIPVARKEAQEVPRHAACTWLVLEKQVPVESSTLLAGFLARRLELIAHRLVADHSCDGQWTNGWSIRQDHE